MIRLNRQLALSVLLALVVGVLYLAPQLLIKRGVEKTGRTFILSQFTKLHDGGDAYIQFAREVADGHFPPSDLFFDHTLPNIYPQIPPLIFGLFIAAIGNVNTAYLFASFIIPAILFLFFYAIGRIVFEKDRLWPIVLGLVGILTPLSLVTTEAFFNISNFANIALKNFYPGIKTALPLLFYARMDQPLLTQLIYLPAIASFLWFWKKPSIVLGIFSGLVSGLLFYTYFHFWVFWVVALGIGFGATLVFFRAQKDRIKACGVMLGTMALVSIPYFINYFALSRLSSGRDLFNRLGIEAGAFFRWNVWPHYLVYAVIIGLVFIVFWRMLRQKEQAVLYWSILLAAFVIWNIQIVLGYVPQSDHWPRAINPLLFIILLHLLWEVVRRWEGQNPKRTRIVLFVVVLALSLLIVKKINNVLQFITLAPEVVQGYVLPEPILDSWQWIENNISDEPKIISPSFLTSVYTAAFTAGRPFLPWGGVAAISDSDLEERFLVANKLFGVFPDMLEKRLRDGGGIVCHENCSTTYIESNLRDARLYLYLHSLTDSKGNKKIPDWKIEELLDRYTKLSVEWKDVDAEYIYYGPWEKQFSQTNLYKNKSLELVYRNDAVELHKIKK